MRKTRKRNIRKKNFSILNIFSFQKKRRGRPRKKNLWKIAIRVLIFFLLAWTFGLIVWYIWLKKNILNQLPSIEKIEELQLAQTSVITDRHGTVLYKIFEENREYVPLSQISKNMINAIIATEDQNFWENPWVDFQWLMRAAIYDITHPGAPKQWWSTLTQQLIKNLLLTRDKTIERKLKEIFLALKLHNYFFDKFKTQYPNLSDQEIERKVKEKILELYLNYIFLWNNAYGVEAASKTYFRKSAKDLDILESAILAWIPKAPSKYNPISNPKLTLGYFEVKNRSWEILNQIPEELKNKILSTAKQKLNNSTLTFVKTTQDVISFLTKLLDFKIQFNWKTYLVKYKPWRKDIVLARMYEERYINSSEFKKAFLEAFNKKIYKPKTEILAPHFVMFVINQLKKQYGEDFLIKWGLVIKTSLDYNIQKLAQDSIEENLWVLQKYNANNAAILYVDSKNGDILAYVGSKDYWDKKIDWQVDIIQSLRQPWSSIKPLVYAFAFMKLHIVEDSPIYDTPIKFGDYSPNNVDWKFMWLMAIKNALPYSRNIPAIKLLKAVGLSNFINFLNQLGISSIKNTPWRYGLSLAIWSAEVKMYEWAQAFAHLSAMWKPAILDPILEIKDKNWQIIYKKQTQLSKQIIPAGVSYIIWDILSNKDNFPPSWRFLYNYPWIKFATKSWTTNKKEKNGKILPRDAWFVAYTPSKVMIFWAWNTDSSPMKPNAFGANLNSPIWKSFVKKLENRWYIKNENMMAVETKEVTINTLNWKLVSLSTPLAVAKPSLWYVKNLPKEKDDTEKIKIDILCSWLVSNLTPPSQISNAYIIKPVEYFYDPYSYQQVINRRKTEWKTKYENILKAKILFKKPTTTCIERQLIAKYWTVKIKIIKPNEKDTVWETFEIKYQVKWPFPIKYVKFYISNKYKKNILVASKKFENKIKNINQTIKARIPKIAPPWPYVLQAIVEDEKGYKATDKIVIIYKK